MNSLTIEQLDDLIQTRHPEEQKIKDLLDSPTEENQLLGLQLARSVLGWSFYDIGYYVLNSGKSWKYEHQQSDEYLKLDHYSSSYEKEFCGYKIYIEHYYFLNDDELRMSFQNGCLGVFRSGSFLTYERVAISSFFLKIYKENFQNIE